MLITTEVYIGLEDTIDWEPLNSCDRYIFYFGKKEQGYGRRCKLDIYESKLKELRNLIDMCLGVKEQPLPPIAPDYNW